MASTSDDNDAHTYGKQMVEALKDKSMLIEILGDKAFEIMLYFYPEESAEVMHREMLLPFQFRRDVWPPRHDTFRCDRWCVTRSTGIVVTKYGLKDNGRFFGQVMSLCHLPGGKLKALTALTGMSARVLDTSVHGNDLWTCFDHGLPHADEEALVLCKTLVNDSTTTDEEFLEACKIIRNARKDGEVWLVQVKTTPNTEALQDVMGTENLYLVNSMRRLAREHRKRTSHVIVDHIEWRNLPEELIDMIRERYVDSGELWEIERD